VFYIVTSCSCEEAQRQRRKFYCATISEGKATNLGDSLEANEELPSKFSEDGSFIEKYGRKKEMKKSPRESDDDVLARQPLSAYI